MEKCKTRPIRIRRIVRRDDIRIWTALDNASNCAYEFIKKESHLWGPEVKDEHGFVVEEADAYGYWSALIENEWESHLYKTELLTAVVNLMLEPMNVFDLRTMAREYKLPARPLADLIAAVYERVSVDIDLLGQDHPHGIVTEIRVWGPDGRFGYTLTADKVGEKEWLCLI